MSSWWKIEQNATNYYWNGRLLDKFDDEELIQAIEMLKEQRDLKEQMVQAEAESMKSAMLEAVREREDKEPWITPGYYDRD